jgi:hypothetical protein
MLFTFKGNSHCRGWEINVHCKKRLTIFPSPAGMSLTKLSLDGNNLIIPVQGEFGKWHPGWGRENCKSFLQCRYRIGLCTEYSAPPLSHIHRYPQNNPPLPCQHGNFANFLRREAVALASTFLYGQFLKTLMNRARIFKLLRSPGIDSNESILPTYVAWRTGMTTLFLLGS